MSATQPRNVFDFYGQRARGGNDRTRDLGVYSPCVQKSKTFLLQSYFSSTLYEQAILAQRPNEPIVASTLESEDTAGHAVGLHPSSETPVTIQFKSSSAASSGASAPVILKPGQVLRPTDGPFTGFTWGLPFGWLGGGAATLIVFTTPIAIVDWDNDSREVLFHRLRLPILAPAAVPAVASGRIDWPIRFPWSNAYSTSTNLPQFGKPSIALNPSRVHLIVRQSSATGIAVAPTLRFILAKFDDYTLTSTGTLSTDLAFFDAVVPTYSNPAGLVNQTALYPVIEYTSGPLLRGGDSAVVTLVDMDDGTDIAGVEVDILRYGRL